jgi:hypothetical protein
MLVADPRRSPGRLPSPGRRRSPGPARLACPLGGASGLLLPPRGLRYRGPPVESDGYPATRCVSYIQADRADAGGNWSGMLDSSVSKPLRAKRPTRRVKRRPWMSVRESIRRISSPRSVVADLSESCGINCCVPCGRSDASVVGPDARVARC